MPRKNDAVRRSIEKATAQASPAGRAEPEYVKAKLACQGRSIRPNKATRTSITMMTNISPHPDWTEPAEPILTVPFLSSKHGSESTRSSVSAFLVPGKKISDEYMSNMTGLAPNDKLGNLVVEAHVT